MMKPTCIRFIPLALTVALWTPFLSAAWAAVRIEASVDGRPWRAASAVSIRQDQTIALRVTPAAGVEIQWYRIIPDISVRYHNAGWPWDPDAYQWKGFDAIRYSREEMTRLRNMPEIDPFQDPAANGDSLLSRLRRFLFQDRPASDAAGKLPLGSFWFQAVLVNDQGTVSSPGLERNDARGLSPQVFRISVRQNDDLLGHLATYFNVPAVFGSVPYQVRHYIGIDCADVLMAAYALWKKQPIETDYNVAMVTRKFPVRARCRIADGVPDAVVRWETEIRPGDFIAVRYDGARQFQHIGALYADAGRPGVLDAADVILHAGPDPLHFTTLASGIFDGEIVVLRPR